METFIGGMKERIRKGKRREMMSNMCVAINKYNDILFENTTMTSIISYFVYNINKN